MAEVTKVVVPDIGDFDAVDVVEVLVAPGDRVAPEDSLISLESDKATMDVPSPAAGVVKEIAVKAGDKVGKGDLILTLEGAEPAAGVRGAAARVPAGPKAPAPAAAEKAPPPTPPAPPPPPAAEPPAAADLSLPSEGSFVRAFASPAVRRFARELGVDLGRVQGSGRKGRILREDVEGFVKRALKQATAPTAAGGIPPMPEIDFSRFGEVETVPLSRIRKVAAKNLHRAWLHVAHVTQHDEADVTELEAFRQAHAEEARQRGFKLTFLAFLVKATTKALREFPQFNSSLAPDGESLIVKKYHHVGIAVDTSEGLVVPVIRDADGKGIFELAAALAEVSGRAREGKLRPEDLTGGSFSITSLGGIGGTAFTPIVNAPEVAILGVSRAATRPVWRDGAFVPRLMLPLSLSYDHRVIDGAAAARFTTYLARVLGDLRLLLL